MISSTLQTALITTTTPFDIGNSTSTILNGTPTTLLPPFDYRNRQLRDHHRHHSFSSPGEEQLAGVEDEPNFTVPLNSYNTSNDIVDDGHSPNGSTTYPSPVLPAYIRTTSMVFCIVIMCLGVVGNVMVPIVIFRTKDMRNSTNIFLVNLSVADLMVLLVCTPTVLVEVNSKPETWVLGEEMCKAVPFVELTVAHASVLTILAISFERYYAICKPLKAGYICTKARASFICLLAWFIAAVFTSPILAITQYGVETYYDGSVVSVCFSKVETLLPSLFFILSISVFFILPLAILLILYALIAKTLMHHPKIMATTTRNNPLGAQSAIKYRTQVVAMLGTVVLAFFVCLLPFRALTLWIIVVPAESIMQLGLDTYYNILYFCRIMLYINSAINPILYNIMSSKFRNGFFKLCGLKTCRKRCARRTDVNRRNTFNTTSSTQTSSQHTSDSFWSRYSNRNWSRNSSSSKGTSGSVAAAPNASACTENECSGGGSVSKGNKTAKESYVRIPLHAIISTPNNRKVVNGESYV